MFMIRELLMLVVIVGIICSALFILFLVLFFLYDAGQKLSSSPISGHAKTAFGRIRLAPFLAATRRAGHGIRTMVLIAWPK
jgi:hypothetical protein